MKHDEIFPPETIDEQVEYSLSASLQESLSPEKRVIQRLAALYEADKRSTERVGQKLAHHLATYSAATQPMLRSLTPLPEERKKAARFPGRSAKSGTSSRFLLVAATLLVVFFVSSMLFALHLVQSNRTGLATGPTKTNAPSGIYLSLSNNLYRLDVQTRKVIWHTPITSNLYPESSVVVSGDTVYLLTINQSTSVTLLAFDAQTGVLRWPHSFQNDAGAFQLLLDNGQLYVYSQGHHQSFLYALNPVDGAFSATYASAQGQKDWFAPSVTLVNNVLYYQSEDHSLFAAVQLSSGKLLWQQPMNQQQVVDEVFVQNSIVYLKVFQPIQHLPLNMFEAFDARNGNKLWQSPASHDQLLMRAVTNDRLYAYAVPDNSLPGRNGDVELLAFDTHTHALVWQKPYKNESMPLAGSGVFYTIDFDVNAAQTQTIAALDATNGKTLWHTQLSARSIFLTSVSGGVLYAYSDSYGSSGSNVIAAFDVHTGSLLWTMLWPTGATSSQTFWGGMSVIE